MDAIAILAKKAADAAFEKRALNMTPLMRFGRSALNTVHHGAQAAKPLFSAGGKFSPGRTAATLGTLGTPALGMSAYNAANSPATGEGSLGWQHQAIKGQDFNAPARGWFSPTAWGRAIRSPVRSVASMFAENGPEKEVGGWSMSGGTPHYNPATGRDELTGGTASRSVTWSPHAQGMKSQYYALKSGYGKAELAHKAKIEQLMKQRQALGGNALNSYGSEDQLRKAWKLNQDITKAQGALKDHSFDPGYGQMQDLEQQLKSIGMLGQRAAGARPATGVLPMTSGVRRSSPDDIYDALRMSAYSPY